MSGIFGYLTNVPARPKNVLLTMQRTLPESTGKQCHIWQSPQKTVGLAIEHSSRLPFKEQGYLAADESVVCVVDGVIFQDAQDGQPECMENKPAQRLLRIYQTRGIAGLKEVSGSFIVAFWDKVKQRLVLATDKIGYRHLFYAQDGNSVYFSSHLARIPQLLSHSPVIDEEAVADLLAYRYVLGERTLFKEIKLLPVGTALLVEDGEVRRQPYWHSTAIQPYGTYNEARLDDLTEHFLLAVKRAFQPEMMSMVTLTGGIDSRTILAAAAYLQLDFVTLTDGDPTGTDAVLARRLSQLLDIPHYSQPVYSHLLGELLPTLVQHDSAMIATIDAHPCQYLRTPLPAEFIISGITGETARSPWIQGSDLAQQNLDHATQLVSRAVLSPLAFKLDLKELWQPALQRIGADAPRDHLAKILGAYRYPASPLMAADYFGLDEHTRKFLNKGSLVALDNMEVVIPYLDHEWLTAIMAVPLEERVQHNILRDLIQRLYPTLLKVPYTKTMLPLDAPEWRVKVANHIRPYWTKANRKLGNMRAAGEIPTHNYSQWSRREMRSTLETLLLNNNAVYHAYLRTESVAPMLEKHFAGEQNWPHLVAALTTLELAHTLWVEKKWVEKKETVIPFVQDSNLNMPVAANRRGKIQAVPA